MIRNKSWEPAHTLARYREIVRNPNGRGRHHLDRTRVPSDCARSLPYEPHAPINQRRVGKLHNDAIRDSPSHVQHFRAISGDPDSRWDLRPRKARRLPVVLNFLTAGKRMKFLHRCFELGPTYRLLSHHAPRTVATSN